jgi:hypothetical protein
MSVELEILEELINSDEFLRSYPTFEAYLSQWDEDGGIEAARVPAQIIFDFYAEKVEVKDALHTWFTYNK